MTETTPPPAPAPGAPPPPAERDANQWAMFIHFSVFAGFLVPFLGLLAPIILWQMKKDEYPSTTAHAYVVLNWLISAFIYTLISIILTFILVGILGLIFVAILTLIYPIIGGIKANEGQLWEYPGSIRFLK